MLGVDQQRAAVRRLAAAGRDVNSIAAATGLNSERINDILAMTANENRGDAYA
jgi:hypothetical protein